MNEDRKENDNDLRKITVYDEDGNELLISVKDWRERVLPDQLKANFNNPDSLYTLIVMSLHDGFYPEILEATEVLLKIDSDKERSHTVRSILLMKVDKLDDAEEVLKNYIKEFSATGVILTNLAKIYDERNNVVESEKILWEALTLDPNQDNGLEWWGAIHRDKGGEKGFYNAIRRAASIEGSWRPQLWLARVCLEKGNLQVATNYYIDILKIARNESEVLMQISGDLGKHGHFNEALKLIYPLYHPENHIPEVGFNLLQCLLEKKDYNEGEYLLQKLIDLKNPILTAKLKYFFDEFEKLKNNEMA